MAGGVDDSIGADGVCGIDESPAVGMPPAGGVDGAGSGEFDSESAGALEAGWAAGGVPIGGVVAPDGGVDDTGGVVEVPGCKLSSGIIPPI